MPNHSHKKHNGKKAYVVDVNMGYGHSRAAYTLKDLSGGEVISANDYRGIPKEDKKLWNESRKVYEAISRLKPVPVIGDFLFEALDHWQQIEKFYPRRDLSAPHIQTKQIYRMIKKGLGKHLIEKLSETPHPLISTFFIPAFFAEYYNYPGDIWCVTTDADISRAWAPLDPKSSRIKYFASNGRVVERLKLYGVREENIFLTGFPLPKSLIGGPNSLVTKKLMMDRICNLDPKGIFTERYKKTLSSHMGPKLCKVTKESHPLTLTYTVGGAGAQRQLGVKILNSLKPQILQHKIRLNLVAGFRKDAVAFYKEAIKKAGLSKELGKWIIVPEFASRADYFGEFDKILETTDILWTKPSEMSFYCGLGIAIIMAPPIGSQEEFNRVWLNYVGGGVSQQNPDYTNEWLFDWINSGGVAKMAWNGYIEAPTHGTYRIEDIVLGRKSELQKLPLIV